MRSRRSSVSLAASTTGAKIGSAMQLEDLLAEDLDVLFCGINPALSAAQAGNHFSHRTNRLWPVLHRAGFTPHQIFPEDDRTILSYRCGLTAAVERPTVKASELKRHEFRASAKRLKEKVEGCRPRFLAFLGKAAFAAIYNKKTVVWGWQQGLSFSGSHVWILPNPSGLNRAFKLEVLVSAYRELRTASEEL